MRFIGLKACDTCKKAQKALTAAGHEITVTDVRADGLAEAELRAWIAAKGIDVLINRRSTTWRGLDEAARSTAETTDGAVALLLEHPTLMKRPVIIAGGDIHVGWDKATQAALL
ncbi:MAG: ArsC/Spx/MgsR family protein [Pseudomonadota bacterium]